MRYSDYHLHSEYSFDSNEKIEKICEKALKENIKELIITDHFEVQDRETYPDFDSRQKIIEFCNNKYGDRLIIKSGVEIGQPHYDYHMVRELIEENDFDFILASLHMVKGYGSLSKFSFSEDNVNDYLTKYMDELEEIASEAEFDVLAHVTLPFRYITQELRKSFPISNFEERYRKIFRDIIKRNKGIEINASGMRTAITQTLPSAEVLRWFESEGGEIVTLGSDGHSARSAFLCLNDAFNELRHTTIGKIAHYTKRILSFEKI